ncbi:MAG: hypothetical protein UY50_C0033G0001, partial [Parcubacteria group bacterium GW2011_GWA2_49_9]
VKFFVEEGLLLRNPDDPKRPTTSGKTVYQIEPSALALLRKLGTSEWTTALGQYLASRESLKHEIARKRTLVRVPVKLPVTVAAGSAFTVVWKSSGTGCVANWSGAVPLPPTGSATGSIITSRPFVITCFGRGAGQSAALQVNVGVTDLAVPTFSISGLKRGKVKGTYQEGPYTLEATVKNLGKLANPNNFKVKYTLANSSDMKTRPRTIGEIAINGIGSNQSKVLDAFKWASTPSVDPSYFQVCADTGEAIVEPSDTNNCSKVLGPYTFSAKPRGSC